MTVLASQRSFRPAQERPAEADGSRGGLASPALAAALRFNDAAHVDLLARARALRPLLERHAAGHEQAGELSHEVIAALDALGAFRMSAPLRVGGLALSSAYITAVISEIAKGCASSAWVVSIVNASVWAASTMPAPMQRRLFAHGVVPMCSPTNGVGTMVPRAGGFLVSGRWSYGSGSHHARWTLVPAATPDGRHNMVALPMEAVRIERSWHVAGMKGTGSDTVVAENVAIAADQSCPFPPSGDFAALDSDFVREAGDYRGGINLLRLGIFAVLVGAAEGLLEATMATKARGVVGSPIAQRGNSALFQAGIGAAAARIGVARSIMERVARLSDARAIEGELPGYLERAEYRGQITVVAELLIAAVESLMSLSGSSAFAEANAAQRLWRDFSIGVRHIVLAIDTGYQMYGCQLMAIQTDAYLPNRI